MFGHENIFGIFSHVAFYGDGDGDGAVVAFIGFVVQMLFLLKCIRSILNEVDLFLFKSFSLSIQSIYKISYTTSGHPVTCLRDDEATHYLIFFSIIHIEWEWLQVH